MFIKIISGPTTATFTDAKFPAFIYFTSATISCFSSTSTEVCLVYIRVQPVENFEKNDVRKFVENFY